MARMLTLVYGAACYVFFFGVFLYLAGFLANAFVPKGIDSGVSPGLWPAVTIDLALIALFGLQHSVMARPAFKQAWARTVPRAVERSTYVLAASLVLALLFWAWQPLPQPVWRLEAPWARALLWTLYAGGFLVVLLSTFMTDHFDLFGLRQVWTRFTQRPYRHPPFQVTFFYRLVRHPLYTGLFLVFWATPDMTVGHLLFAAGMSAYVLIAVPLEERDLERIIGERYAAYCDRVPRFLPLPGKAHPRVESGDEVPSGMR